MKKTQCPHFIRKSGGYGSGFKCRLFYNGEFTVYVSQNRKLTTMEMSFDIKERDNFVNNVCKSEFLDCSYYKNNEDCIGEETDQ